MCAATSVLDVQQTVDIRTRYVSGLDFDSPVIAHANWIPILAGSCDHCMILQLSRNMMDP